MRFWGEFMTKMFKSVLSVIGIMGLLGISSNLLNGCSSGSAAPVQSSDVNIASIAIDETTMPSVIYIGEFDNAGIKLLVTYSDGSSESVSVTEKLVPDAYKHYLETPGEWNVTIYYRGITTVIKLNVQYRYFVVDFYAMVATSTLTKISSQSVKKGDSAIAPDIPVETLAYEHTLYTFKSWDVDFTKITSDLKVTAIYNEETIYWVSFFKGDNSLISKQYVKEGGNATSPTPSEYEMSGYDFIGWDRGFSNVTKDLNIYGIYVKVEKASSETWNGSVSSGYFGGLYPQTVVEDQATINALSVITSANSKGYLEYNGSQYYKTSAVVNGLTFKSTSGKTTFSSGSTYYFKVEPLKWRVLASTSTTVTVLSEYDLQAMAFDDDSNNYQNSNIRKWLIDDFYNRAFNDDDKKRILTTTVDNSVSSTTDSSNSYVCGNTEDKVFLLSRKELSFLSGGYAAKATDYARVTNAYMNNDNCGWWLRSPRTASSMASWCIGYVGDVYAGNNCTVSDTCARPALTISIQ
jgi:hypothetical protein